MKDRNRTLRCSAALLAVLPVLCFPLMINAAIAQPPIASWTAGSALSQARAGACAALLQDGRILISGGDDGTGPSISADFMSPSDGSISPAPSMLQAREGHVCVTLQDGRVLIAGGAAGGVVINEAEIYDPAANSWSSVAGGMVEARSAATATLLQNGEVVIAGGAGNGAVSSTAEIFDPGSPADGNLNAFSLAGNLSSPRQNHAAALLPDGRVLIAGGSNGSAPLATSDIYSPATGTIASGPAMAAARQGLSATALLNGLILIAGGNDGSQDLASLELFDPSANAGAGGFAAPLDASANPVSLGTARQGQQALLLPHNGAVLVFGGTSSGVAVASAELFSPSVSSTGSWSYADAATGAMTAARANFVASPLSNGTPLSTNDGVLLAAGGIDASGSSISSTELYGFPWIKSDQSDYAPGTTANLTGGGFQPGETVQWNLVESPLGDNDAPPPSVADANGNISAQFPVDSQDANVRFYLTAVGQSSGRQAQATFTDLVIGGGGGGGGTPVPLLTVSKTHTTPSSSSWIWSITVSNTGTANSSFPSGSSILQDDLPNSNISYGAVSGAPTGVSCSISNYTLTCTATAAFTLYYSSNAGITSFTVQFQATASTTGTYSNPRTSGICEVNPSDVLNAGNQPTCSDSVTLGSNTTTFTLTYTAGTGGTISGTSPQTVNSGGSGTTVTAVPNTGYSFVNWSDGVTTASRTDTNVTANISVTANFAIDTFTLTYTAGTGGAISGTSPQAVNYNSSGSTVTAVPNTGYHFVNWSDGVTTASRTDTNVTADVSVTANFAINTFTLTYTAGTGGTITGTSPQTVNYNSSGTTVTAVPNTGYHFVNWSDGLLTASRTDTNVTADISVTANFAINTFTLTYTAGTGGTISGTSPQTVNYNSSGTTVTAVPNTGYHFVNWSDGLLTASRTDTNVTANISVTANFVINTFTLTYTAGTGGTISGITPQTVNYGASGSTVNAVPSVGYHFVSWSDGLLTASRTDTNVTANLSVTASFAPNTTTVAATVTPLYYRLQDGTTSASNPAPASCSSSTIACQQYSDEVLLQATATGSPTPALGQFAGTIDFKIGTTLATATTVASGVSLSQAATGATVALTLAPNSGYRVYAVFNSTTAYYPSADNSLAAPSLAVVPEDAQVTFGNPSLYFSTTSSTATSISFSVTFTLQDATATGTSNSIYDPYAGNITKAVPVVTLTGIAPTGSYGSCTPNVALVSTGTATITCSFSNVPVPGAYSLSVSPGTGSYYNFVGDTSMPITTANGGSGFITGGGFQTQTYLTTQNSSVGKYTNSGFLAPAPGTRMDFGFQAVSKKNSKLTGGVNLIIRSACLTNISGYTGHPGDDHLCVYQIKVSQGQLQTVSENLTSKPTYAQLTGSANIQDVTGPTPVSVAGNLSLILQMYDVADPGANQDTLAIQVTDNNYGLWISNNWSGTKTVINTTSPQIQGGNLQVH